MNGTEIDKRINMFNQIGDLEYTDVEAFCLTTWRYRKLAFYYEPWPYLVPNLEELTENP